MPARIKNVILKVVETCNLNCSYCYMYNQVDQSYLHRPKMMSEAVYLRTLLMLRSYCDEHDSTIGLSFHGGEPTLMGKQAFIEKISQARNILGERIETVSIQTNGTLLDEEWVDIFTNYGVSIGISIDGPKSIHDKARVDFQGRGSHDRVIRSINMLNGMDIPFTALCVINPSVDGMEVYRFLSSLNIPVIDFMFPDVSHDNIHTLRADPDATPVADYLIPIFDEWISEDNPDNKIRLFWGMLRILMGAGGITDAFGNPKLSYLVVESDGSIQGNDVLKVCAEGMAETNLNVLTHSFNDLENESGKVAQMVKTGLPLCKQCNACLEKNTCSGGYLPHRYKSINGFDNPSVWCKDILKLFDHMRNHIAKSVTPKSEKMSYA